MGEVYVFDTEALVAFLYEEPGHQTVSDRLGAVAAGEADGLLSEMNACELSYLVARIERTPDDEPTAASLRAADRDVRALERQGLAIERADWRRVAEIKAHGGLSLADACGVALARDRDGTLVVGGDADFETLPVDVPVEQFRDHGV